jgi:pilus assembly protein Flp/PilA
MKKLSRNKKQKGQGLVEYALILVLVAIVVIAALMVLGPIIGNVFSGVNSSLSGIGGGDSATAAPHVITNADCASVHSDGYATGAGYGWDCYSPSASPHAYNAH